MVPNVTSSIDSNGGVGSTISRITNSFQVNGGVTGNASSGSGLTSGGNGPKKAPPVPPNKPTVSLYKPLSKLEGIVNSSDARGNAIDLAK